MNQIEFLFQNLKPVSANHRIKRGRSGHSYKSREAVNFDARVRMQVNQQRSEVFAFEGTFSPYDHFLCAEINIYIPRSALMTKKGYISKKSMDIDNMFKQTIDSAFKEFEKLDDAWICKLFSSKTFSHDNNYHIYLSLLRQDLEVLNDSNK
jgi:Holliday junction resolvase RusA-like endonuclease